MEVIVFGLSIIEIVTIIAAVIAAIGIIAALATQPGRDAFALLGLRVADALTRWLEARLSVTQRELRK
jgi:hypothetical protein